jgi:hypothetical protein
VLQTYQPEAKPRALSVGDVRELLPAELESLREEMRLSSAWMRAEMIKRRGASDLASEAPHHGLACSCDGHSASD